MGTVWLTQLTKLGKVDISKLSSGARFMLMIYCDAADNDTGVAFPGTPRLMRLSGYGERQVQRYVQELREHDFLQLVKNRGGRRMYATYRLQLVKSSVPAESRAELERMGLSSSDNGEGDDEAGADPPAS